MKNITIINAYGDKNIGDAAILTAALHIIKDTFGKSNISVLCESSESIESDHNRTHTYQLPYGYAIQSKDKKANELLKGFRLIQIYIISFTLIALNIIFRKNLSTQGFYSYITSIKNADIIIGMGGGYLTTNSLKDYFGLLLTLLPVYISKIYKKNIVFLPMSFGPFSNSHQETLAYNAIKNTTVMARDRITLKQIKHNDIENKVSVILAPDLALLTKSPFKENNKTFKYSYITLTARQWFADSIKQKKYEETLKYLIEKVWEKYQLKTIFIPMANNEIEDNDIEVANRLYKSLANKKILKIIKPKNPLHVQKIQAKAQLAICTRMHSAILAITTHTPFIAIGYGHKTLGLVQNFNLKKWHIDINELEKESLLDLTKKLLKKENYLEFINTVSRQQVKNYTYRSKISKLLKYSIT